MKIRASKTNNGITLIALVITIIVLLILAGVTIATLMGDNGIINQATNAKEETRGATVEEAKELWEVEKENGTAKTLEELLEDLGPNGENLLTEDEIDEIIGNEQKGIIATGKVTIGSRTIVFKEKSVVDYVKIGDYVKYNPQTQQKSYEFLGIYTGYGTDQVLSAKEMKWRVISIDEEKVEIIATEPTDEVLYLKGALGYNNGVYLLNDYCNKIYGNEQIGAIGRSINIEDIQEILDLTVWDYREYTDSDSKYGETNVFEKNLNYPYMWSKQKTEKSKIDGKLINGNEENSQQNELTTETVYTANESIEVQKTSWSGQTLREQNFKKVESRNSEVDSEIYGELLKTRKWYYIATRCESIYDGFSYAAFSLYIKANSGIGTIFGASGQSLYYSDGTSYRTLDEYIWPIVTIPAKLINLDEDYNTTSGWDIKN